MPVSSTDFLKRKQKDPVTAIYVVFGDETFLHRQVVDQIRQLALGDDPDDLTYAVHDGKQAAIADVLDDLFTPPFLGDRRLVHVEEGEPFISQHRDALERYAKSPSECGVLLLEAKTWRSNTKLAKAIEKDFIAVDASAPKAWHVPDWVVRWSRDHYKKQLDRETAAWLVELAGTELGQLDQELAKLTTYVGEAPAISIDAVNKLVAGTRTETAFKLLDMVLGGEASRAIELLDRMLVAGESPVSILAMATAQLRKLTRAAREAVAGVPLESAIKNAGIPPFAVQKSATQLRRLGRKRMAHLYRRLLRADLDIKGGTALAPRAVLERFLLDLART
ncbi:DNA polymerase III subunit delta [Planctomycetes bacterium Pan216]|uniref:DNA polymerase III subunit delta n=1 Tax=Kolteria novifilia TaxID=2527975 RepID=A0A518AZF2_9BACT|nr:DNA polymerase III subunit delta [Planctomycetes bacterium Pan216]